AQPECGLECLPLRIGQLRQRSDDRKQELVQARKSELGFRFNSARDQRSSTPRRRSLAHSLEQNRLSDSGLAPDDKCSPAVVETIDQRVQECGLLLSLEQLGAGVDQGHPAHRASMSATGCSAQLTRQLTTRRSTSEGSDQPVAETYALLDRRPRRPPWASASAGRVWLEGRRPPRLPQTCWSFLYERMTLTP